MAVTASGSRLGALRALLVAAIVVPLGMTLGMTWLTWQQVWSEAERDVLRGAEAAAEYTLRVLEAHRLAAGRVNELLRGLSDDDIRNREQELHAGLRRLLPDLPLVQTVVVLDRDGRLLVTGNIYPVPRDQTFNDREWMSILRERGAPSVHLSRVYVGRLDRFLFFGVSRRRSDAGNGLPADAFDGVINLSVQPNELARGFADLASLPQDRVLLVRADGQILARLPGFEQPPAPLNDLTFRNAVEAGPRPRTLVVTSSVDGARILVGFRPVRGYGAYTVVGRETSVIVAQWQEAVLPPAAIGLAATIGLVLLAAVALARARQAQVAQAALVAAQNELFQAQKMEALGQLTGGIAHDFNNILSAIIVSLESVRRGLDSDGDRVRRLDRALQAARNAAALVQQLLVFAHKQPLQPRPLNANDLLAGSVAMFRRSAPENVRVVTELAGGLPAVLADPGQMQAAVFNLLSNARDAIPDDGGTITVRSFAGHADAASAALPPVCISVADTGSGMAPEVMARAVEPFFSTKGVGHGTGLGLSMVYGALRQMGGDVTIDSAPGRGTTVTLFLPASAEAPAAESTALPQVPPAPGSLRKLLYVEDDALVALSTVETLHEFGYDVVEASDGPAALQALQRDPSIDLMVSDVGLPGMDGHQLVARARELRPDLRVLLVSGYDRARLLGSASNDPQTRYLGKPFGTDDLRATLAALRGDAATDGHPDEGPRASARSGS